MRRRGLLVSLLPLGAGGLLSACTVENTPHAPTFAADVLPIMLSRCVRCHGAGGKLNHDAHTTLARYAQPFDGFFDRMEDDCADGAVTGCHGLGHYTSGTPETLLHDYIHATTPDGKAGDPMPPAPAPRLTSNQLDIIDLWLANGAPAE